MLFRKKKQKDKPIVVNVERKEQLVLGCESSNRCADYIVMKSTLEEKLNKAIVAKNVALAQKDAYIHLLDELCPDWRQKAVVEK